MLAVACRSIQICFKVFTGYFGNRTTLQKNITSPKIFAFSKSVQAKTDLAMGYKNGTLYIDIFHPTCLERTSSLGGGSMGGARGGADADTVSGLAGTSRNAPK